MNSRECPQCGEPLDYDPGGFGGTLDEWFRPSWACPECDYSETVEEDDDE